MSIQEHLNKIRNAIYGREVRESIAKGIETAYNDASEKDNANLEVKMARGTNSNLNARLNKMEDTDRQTTAQLAQTERELKFKPDKTENGWATLNTFDEPTRAVIQGLEPGQINAVLGRDNVSEINASFVEKSTNLFNPKNVVYGQVDKDTGDIYEDNNYRTSELITVLPNEDVTFVHLNYLSFYDGSGTFVKQVSGLLPDGSNYTAPVTVNTGDSRFVRATYNRSTREVESIQINYGSTLLPYEEYVEPFLSKNIGVKGSSITGSEITPENTTFVKKSANLFNKNDIIEGFYIVAYNGSRAPSANNFIAENISVEPNTSYTYSGTSTAGIRVAYRDALGDFISGESLHGEEGTLTTPALTNYIDFSAEISNKDSIQFEKGGKASPYEPYGIYFLDEKIKTNTENIETASHLAGKNIVFFGDSITGMYEDRVAYPNLVEKRLGINALNVGFSGTRATATNSESTHYYPFSFTKLIDSVVSGDFTNQETQVVNGGTMYQPHFDRLKEIDFNEVDIVTIAYGTNDYGGSVAIDNESEPLDPTTYKGAYRYGISKLLEEYPHIKIVLISSTWRGDTQDSNNADLFTQDYVNALIELGKELNYPVINLFNEGQINEYNYGYYLQPDKLHPLQSTGLPLIGEIVASRLESVL